MSVDQALPGVLLGLLEAEGDPLAIAVDIENLHIDRLANGENFRRMIDVAPRQLGNVDEAVYTFQIDEGAEIDNVGDDALDDVARLELAHDLLPDFLALLFKDGALGEDDVVAAAVELDDPAGQDAAHVFVQVLDCLLYTSDVADEEDSVDLGGRRIIK